MVAVEVAGIVASRVAVDVAAMVAAFVAVAVGPGGLPPSSLQPPSREVVRTTPINPRTVRRIAFLPCARRLCKTKLVILSSKEILAREGRDEPHQYRPPQHRPRLLPD